MRITFVLPYAGMAGGIRVVAIYAERLKARGHEVTLISTRHRWPSRREQLKHDLRSFILKLRGIPEPSHLNDIDVPHTRIRNAGPVLDKHVPDGDVVVATWWETAPWVADLSPSKGAKAYFMQDYGAPGQELEDVQATWNLPLRMITISGFLRDLIHEQRPGLEIDLVPNGVDMETLHAPERGKQPAPTVGFVYREWWAKGSDIVLEAFALARMRAPQLRLLTYGPKIPEAVSPLPEGMEFRHRPGDDELREIYAACDAWILASRREGFGLPILEAMACRTPVIATPTGAARELVESGGGMLIEPESAESMADAMVRFAEMDDAAWRAMSDAALDTARRHTWEKATDRMEAALVRAAEG
jgi:glycosyltransferase involved in cell wall biosynthesis